MASEPKASAKAAIRAQIDENLKRVYQDALEEELPDRFKLLLAKLSAGEAVSEETAPEDSVTEDRG